MKTILQSKSEKRPLIKIHKNAYDVLPHLCKQMAEEKGLNGITYLDAVSIAVFEAKMRRDRREQRRLQKAAQV